MFVILQTLILAPASTPEAPRRLFLPSHLLLYSVSFTHQQRQTLSASHTHAVSDRLVVALEAAAWYTMGGMGSMTFHSRSAHRRWWPGGSTPDAAQHVSEGGCVRKRAFG